jgi:hypothetical protein
MERQRRKEATMAEYEVTATRIVNHSLVVEANSEAEAIAIADQTDPAEFGEIGHEFTIDYAEEIK